jgi:hypothetical protein
VGPVSQLPGEADMPESTHWRRASRCAAQGCIEVARLGERVGVRDSARPEVVVLVDKADFLAFVQGVKGGDFDDLVA